MNVIKMSKNAWMALTFLFGQKYFAFLEIIFFRKTTFQAK